VCLNLGVQSKAGGDLFLEVPIHVSLVFPRDFWSGPNVPFPLLLLALFQVPNVPNLSLSLENIMNTSGFPAQLLSI
jgi:hypothetical protein